jgi:hypothetical protein
LIINDSKVSPCTSDFSLKFIDILAKSSSNSLVGK